MGKWESELGCVKRWVSNNCDVWGNEVVPYIVDQNLEAKTPYIVDRRE